MHKIVYEFAKMTFYFNNDQNSYQLLFENLVLISWSTGSVVPSVQMNYMNRTECNKQKDVKYRQLRNAFAATPTNKFTA